MRKTLFNYEVDRLRLCFDMGFILLAGIAFYKSIVWSMLAVLILLLLSQKFKKYARDKSDFYLDAFIDFLNQINSNMSIGMGFDSSILSSALLLKSDQSYSAKAIEEINRFIKMGVSTESVFSRVTELFPISEAKLYARMMKISKETGANPSDITGITIDKLYLKHKVNHEIHTILFQKKLEQTILCVAPMVVILFIRLSTPEYLSVLDGTLAGKIVMTSALSLIVVMKLISERLVNIKF